jgi:hypothetical protein
VTGKSLRAALGEQHTDGLLEALAHARARAGGNDMATIGFELRARSADGAALVCHATLVGDKYVVARILSAKPEPSSRPAERAAAVSEMPAQRQRLCA